MDGYQGNLEQVAYQKAAAIADRLLAEGFPLIGFEESDHGAKVGFAFLLPSGRQWAFRVPVDNLRLEAVRGMVEAYL